MLFSLSLRALVASIVIAAYLLWTALASAETIHRGKVVQVTADRIIADRQLVCDYSKPRFEALPDGRTVIIMGKVCTEVSR